jgi:flagellar basal body rod protein FlgF
MRKDRRFMATLVSVTVLLVALAAVGLLLAGCQKEEPTTTTVTIGVIEKTLAPGEDWAITETTELDILTIGEGATITPPEGKSVTLTVDGVETGQVLKTTDGYDLVFVPGTYQPDVVVTLADANPVEYAPAGPTAEPIVSPFRQAICVDEAGFSEAKSVLAAVRGDEPTAEGAESLSIISTGECFNGIYAASSYSVKDVEINLTGNARSDFSGYGAAVVGTGEGTTLVLDGANIVTTGVARSGVVATNGASVVVKNSDISTSNGELPVDYVPTIDTAQMRSVPWMLGLSGNVRATNLLGTNTKATYINSGISSEGWGVLSTDGCTTPTLTAINSTISITGEDGYGSYGIGDATENFLGCTFDVATYATISRGSFLYYGDSTPEKVNTLNRRLGLGLTPEELAAIPDQPTIVNSQRFGIMWHGGGTLEISGGTEFNTKEATFLDKGQAIKITVDGIDGVKLNPENGIIMQFMDDDDPGPDFTTMQNTGTYNEPTDAVVKDETHDLTTAGDSAAVATFKNIELTGDFYNSTRGGLVAAAAPPGGAAPAGDAGAATGETSTTAAGAAPAGATTTTAAAATTTTVAAATTTTVAAAAAAGETTTTAAGEAAPAEMTSNSKNLGLTFDNVKITGIITASTAAHAQATINSADYRLLGTVTNTPAAAVNNGVVVVLMNASVWTVTGTSYLTSLTIGEGCSITVPDGKKLTFKVDGKKKKLEAKTYTGRIELIVEDVTTTTTK